MDATGNKEKRNGEAGNFHLNTALQGSSKAHSLHLEGPSAGVFIAS